MPPHTDAPAAAQAVTWPTPVAEPPLSEVFASVAIRKTGSFWRRMFAFMGPGYLVAVGYMDPGNWATSLAGGSAFGYTLLSVVVLSSLMAILLQALAIRLGLATGRDLAQACRDAYPKPAAAALWVLAEIAICATDLAEVIGTAIGLQLLFGIPLILGIVITAADVLLILLLQNLGFRWLEAFVFALILVVAGCFGVQIALAHPDVSAILGGLIPTTEIITNEKMLPIALGILGATVMPHNLYLHSSVVQTRRIGDSLAEKREAIGFATLDSTIALGFALLVNASILILAAATFHNAGHTEVAEIQDAHKLLAPILGGEGAATLFALALIACGLNSTITATLAGQVVMEGFLRIRLKPWLRRMVTRLIAIVPALLVTLWAGPSATAKLLIVSQIVLSLQLPFAVVPLITMTANRGRMGELVSPRWMSVLAGAIAIVIVVLNTELIWIAVRG